MATARALIGLAGLICLVIALNILLVTGDTFSPFVLLCIGLAAASGFVWLVLLAIGVAKKSQGDERSARALNAVIACVVFLGICVVIYAFASRWDASWDLTAEGRAALAPLTVQVLQGLDTDVEALAFFPAVSRADVEIAREKTGRFLERAEDLAGAYLDVEILDIESNILRLQELEIPNIPSTAVGIVVVRAGNQKRLIALEGANPRLREADFTNALINVIRAGNTKVYFLSGHGEMSPSEEDEERRIQMFQRQLVNQGYNVDELIFDLDNPVVPEDCGLLVIADPTAFFRPAEMVALHEYAKRAGRFFVLVDPPFDRIGETIQSDLFKDWLERVWGISPGDDMIVSYERRQSVLLTHNLEGFPDDPNSAFRGSYNYQHPITRGFQGEMLFKVTRSIGLMGDRPEGVSREPLLRTRKGTWAETKLRLLIQEQNASPEPGEKEGPITVGVAATMKTDVPVGDTEQTRDARLVAVGNTAFISDHELPHNPWLITFALNSMSWLTETEELIGTPAVGEQQTPIILSERQAQIIAWISTLGALQVVLAAGIVVYLLRRKYQ